MVHCHLPHIKPCVHRAFTARRPCRQQRVRCEGSNGDGGSGKDVFTEDVLARLRKAEAEAAALREQLQTVTAAAPVNSGVSWHS